MLRATRTCFHQCARRSARLHSWRDLERAARRLRHVRLAALRVVRILLVSQMYPGPDDPDLGTFVAQVERALGDRGMRSSARCSMRAPAASVVTSDSQRRPARVARRFRPDVVYAHFLVPTGFTAAVATRSPLVVTAHGRDVRNIGAYPGIAAATRLSSVAPPR